MSDRWATFDCYGTIADWHGGMHAALRGPGRRPGRRAARCLPRARAGAGGREAAPPVPRRADARGCGAARPSSGIDAAGGRGRRARARAGRSMPFHADAPDGLVRLRDAGWRLAVLTNCDDDLWATTAERLPVDFDLVVTAQQVGSYKPRARPLRALPRDRCGPTRTAGCTSRAAGSTTCRPRATSASSASGSTATARARIPPSRTPCCPTSTGLLETLERVAARAEPAGPRPGSAPAPRRRGAEQRQRRAGSRGRAPGARPSGSRRSRHGRPAGGCAPRRPPRAAPGRKRAYASGSSP